MTHYNSDVFDHCPICQAQKEEIQRPDESWRNMIPLVMQLFNLLVQSNVRGNLAVSPDGLYQVLSLLLVGATGATQKLLENYLHSAGHPDQRVNGDHTQNRGYESYDVLLLSTAHQLQDGFHEQVEQYAPLIRGNINFRDRQSLTETVKQLNGHIHRLSMGMIASTCNPHQLPPDTSISLINSVYFRSRSHSFSCRPWRGLFTCHDGTRVVLNSLMHGELEAVGYADIAGWQAISLPFQHIHDLVLILPPFATEPSRIPTETVIDLLSSLQPTDINLRLPPFEINTTIDLNPLLTGTGLGSLFEPGSVSLGAMLAASSEPVFLSTVRQNCMLSVNERIIGVPLPSHTTLPGATPAVNIYFDHPFLCMVRNRTTQKILFVGQVMNPAEAQGK